MRDGPVLRRIRPVDITPVLAVLDQLKFVAVNIGSTNPAKSPCSVVIPSAVPQVVKDWVASLDLGGETKRILFRKLAPRQSMAPHVDAWMDEEAEWRRFQVPLVSDPSVVMRWPEDGVTEHLEPGWIYQVRFDRLHEVVNGWDGERIHLQMDQVNATV